MHRDAGLAASQLEFFHHGLENDRAGRAGVDRQVARRAVGDDRQPVGVLVLDELGSGITVRDDVLVERIEGDRAERVCEGHEGGTENGKKDEFRHEGES